MKNIEAVTVAIMKGDELLLIWKKGKNTYKLPWKQFQEEEILNDVRLWSVLEMTGYSVPNAKYLGYREFKKGDMTITSHDFLAEMMVDYRVKIKNPGVGGTIWIPVRDYEQYLLSNNTKDFFRTYFDRSAGKFVGKKV